MNETSGAGYAPRYPAAGTAGHYGSSGAGQAPSSARARRGGTKKGGGLRTLVVAVAAGIIGAMLVLLLMPLAFGVSPVDLIRGRLKQTAVRQETAKGTSVSVVSTGEGSTSVAAIAKEVTPSIVNIDVRTNAGQDPFMTGQSQGGAGSGVIYSKDGYIITNNHVVENAQDITVTLASGAELKGTRVGADPENDVAVVKVDKTGLPALTVGDSDNLVVGQLAVAVGSPFGFEQTVTSGIVSALHRSIQAGSETGGSTVLTDLIQTDAAINPGNSGGALCDGEGKLIGINAVIATASGGSEGVGFAIPINTAKKVADDLIAGREVSHPYIGIQGQTVSSETARQYDLEVSQGAYISRVVQGSPAEEAGLRSGDIVVAAGGTTVKSIDDLISAIRKTEVGEKISLTYQRGSEKQTTDMTVQEEPQNLR